MHCKQSASSMRKWYTLTSHFRSSLPTLQSSRHCSIKSQNWSASTLIWEARLKENPCSYVTPRGSLWPKRQELRRPIPVGEQPIAERWLWCYALESPQPIHHEGFQLYTEYRTSINDLITSFRYWNTLLRLHSSIRRPHYVNVSALGPHYVPVIAFRSHRR